MLVSQAFSQIQAAKKFSYIEIYISADVRQAVKKKRAASFLKQPAAYMIVVKNAYLGLYNISTFTSTTSAILSFTRLGITIL